jgi:hypothetical protein
VTAPSHAIVFVEDPGAANQAAELPEALEKRGLRTTLLAYGPAVEFLELRASSPFTAAEEAEAEAILERYRPALVVVGTSENPRSPALDLVRASAERGIPTVGIVDSPASSAQRFRGTTSDPLAYAPDWILVPDAWTKSHYVGLGHPEGRVVACGHPHYDFVRAFGEKTRDSQARIRAELFPEAAPGRRVVVFAADLSTGLDPAAYRRSPEYTLTGRGENTGRTEIVLEEFLDAVSPFRDRAHCVMRLHPKHEGAELEAYVDEFDQVSQAEPSLDVIVGADAAVGMTTMLLVEALLLGRPTLSIVPREIERGWLATTQYELTPCVTTRPAVRAEVARLIEEAPLPDDGRVELVLPRDSLARTADAIVHALADGSPGSAGGAGAGSLGEARADGVADGELRFRRLLPRLTE